MWHDNRADFVTLALDEFGMVVELLYFVEACCFKLEPDFSKAQFSW